MKETELPQRSKSHRITGWLGLEWTSGDHLNPTIKAGSARTGWTGSNPRGVLNISMEGDSTIYLGNLFQCLVTLKVKKFFPIFRWIFMGFSLWLVSLVLSLDTPDKSLASSSWQPPLRYLYTFPRFLLLLLLTTDVHSHHLHGRRDDIAPFMWHIVPYSSPGKQLHKKKPTNPSSLSLPLSLSVTPSHLLFLSLFITFLEGLRQCKSTLRQKALLNWFL